MKQTRKRPLTVTKGGKVFVNQQNKLVKEYMKWLEYNVNDINVSNWDFIFSNIDKNMENRIGQE